jgi:atrial natriuretic peptide receptor B
MLHKLEKYAADLESIVGQRTGELVSEKLKSDTLLYSMLPKLVVDDW